MRRQASAAPAAHRAGEAAGQTGPAARAEARACAAEPRQTEAKPPQAAKPATSEAERRRSSARRGFPDSLHFSYGRRDPQPLVLSAGGPGAGAKGVVGVAFTIGASGALAAFAITRSSGDADLDAAARTLVNPTHFPPPPGGSVRVATSFNYVPR